MHEKIMDYLKITVATIILFGGLFLVFFIALNLPQPKTNSTEISRDIIVSIDDFTWSCRSYQVQVCGVMLDDCIDNFNNKVASISCVNDVKFYDKSEG
jgi:hypothetical protein